MSQADGNPRRETNRDRLFINLLGRGAQKMMDVYTDTRKLSLFAEDMVQRQTGPVTFVADSAPEFGTLFTRLIEGFLAWNRRRAIETELYGLSAHMLADIGVNREEIPALSRKWALAEIRRERAERAVIKATKAVKVAPISPSMEEMLAKSSLVANDDGHKMAA